MHRVRRAAAPYPKKHDINVNLHFCINWHSQLRYAVADKPSRSQNSSYSFNEIYYRPLAKIVTHLVCDQ